MKFPLKSIVICLGDSARALYLLINGGIAAGCGHPHLLVEAIADGVDQVDAGVRVTSQDGPGFWEIKDSGGNISE